MNYKLFPYKIFSLLIRNSKRTLTSPFVLLSYKARKPRIELFLMQLKSCYHHLRIIVLLELGSSPFLLPKSLSNPVEARTPP